MIMPLFAFFAAAYRRHCRYRDYLYRQMAARMTVSRPVPLEQIYADMFRRMVGQGHSQEQLIDAVQTIAARMETTRVDIRAAQMAGRPYAREAILVALADMHELVADTDEELARYLDSHSRAMNAALDAVIKQGHKNI